MDGSQQTNDSTGNGFQPFHASPCSVPVAWLQERATFYRARSEERPHEFQEYRRMAWACGVVQEIWQNWIDEQEAQNMERRHPTSDER